MKLKNVFLGILFVNILMFTNTFAIAPPFENKYITSDYSPRILGGFEFHDGIDYDGGDEGLPIPAVEKGTVSDIDKAKQLRKAWIFTFKSNEGNNWTYMH